MISYFGGDVKKAESLIMSAERDMKFTLKIKPSEESAAIIVRNIYESFRMLGEALLANQGVKSKDHVLPIRELLKLNVKSERPIQILESIKTTRHNINYQGYVPNMAEVRDIIDIANKLFNPVLKEVKKRIKSLS